MARFAIEQYVDQKNQWAGLFGGKKLSLLNKADRQRIADSLDADLSPENLSCDGELPRAEVQKRYNFLTRAAKELKSIDPAVEMYGF
jgi:hypothetical protein